jgi:predicted Zn-dependent protease
LPATKIRDASSRRPRVWREAGRTTAPAAKQAVALNPWNAAYRERLAYVSLQLKDWNGALVEAREALRLNPFQKFARMFLVQCLLRQKDAKAADNELNTLVKLNPDQRESLEQWFAAQRPR